MKVISLFSGAGGLDLGLIQAGHKVTWANDIDTDCVETYRRNIGDHIVLGDISTMDVGPLPSADLVVGGFPCQGFSLANLRRSGADSRNKLYREFVRVVRHARPAYFLAENVRGILSLEGGTAILRILEEFREIGYDVDYRLLNAADYGVPQSRWRVFIVGVRLDLARSGVRFEFPAASHGRSTIASPKPAVRSWVSVGEALKELPPLGSATVPNHVASNYKVVARNFTGHRLTDPSKPSPTILARGNGGGGVCAIPHPWEARRMSVRESATVQTFPVEFEFVGRLNSCYRQVGNAVPPRLGLALGSSFVDLPTRVSEVA